MKTIGGEKRGKKHLPQKYISNHIINLSFCVLLKRFKSNKRQLYKVENESDFPRIICRVIFPNN